MTGLFNEVPMSEEAQEILGKTVSLAAPKELPETFLENRQRIWEAFELSGAYERCIQNQTGGEPKSS